MRKQIELVQGLISAQQAETVEFESKQLSYYREVFSNIANEEALGLSPREIDGDYWRIVKGNPLYPRDAYQERIEGYVIVEYDLNPSGDVENPRIIESVPEGVFDKSALSSVTYSKYLPRVIQGEALEVKGLQSRLTYSLSR